MKSFHKSFHEMKNHTIFRVVCSAGGGTRIQKTKNEKTTVYRGFYESVCKSVGFCIVLCLRLDIFVNCQTVISTRCFHKVSTVSTTKKLQRVGSAGATSVIDRWVLSFLLFWDSSAPESDRGSHQAALPLSYTAFRRIHNRIQRCTQADPTLWICLFQPITP